MLFLMEMVLDSILLEPSEFLSKIKTIDFYLKTIKNKETLVNIIYQ